MFKNMITGEETLNSIVAWMKVIDPVFKLLLMIVTEHAIKKLDDDISEMKLILNQLLEIQTGKKQVKKKEFQSPLIQNKTTTTRNRRNKRVVVLA